MIPARPAGTVRLAYAADLHGDAALYRDLDALVRAAGADALCLGGDLFAHAAAPAPQIAFADGPLRAWLAALPVPAFVIWGNVDWPVACGVVRRLRGLVRGPGAVLGRDPVPGPGGIRLLGYAAIPPTPFRRKDGERRDLACDGDAPLPGSHRSRLDGSVAALPPGGLAAWPSIEQDLAGWGPAQAGAVWVAHGPPHGGPLDLARDGRHVGSRALRQAIVRLQPPLCLHGHIHEAPGCSGAWVERLGRSICVNPGRGTRLHGVLADLRSPDGQVAGLWHTTFGPAPP